jgi:transporter family-2 protein
MKVVMYLLAMIAGAALSLEGAIYGELGKNIGQLESSLYNFAIGSIILALLVLFWGKGNLSTVTKASKWQLSAVFLGVLFLSLLVLTVPKIGVVGAGIATIAGQLIAGMMIDHFGVIGLHIPMTTSRYVVVVALILAIVCIFKSHQFSKVTSQNVQV